MFIYLFIFQVSTFRASAELPQCQRAENLLGHVPGTREDTEPLPAPTVPPPPGACQGGAGGISVLRQGDLQDERSDRLPAESRCQLLRGPAHQGQA